MISNRLLGAATLLLFPMLCAAANHGHEVVVDFSSVMQHPREYHEAWITMRGYVAVDDYGHQYLFGSRESLAARKFPESVDLLPQAGKEAVAAQLVDGACAEIRGRFEGYGRGMTIPSGYLLSEAGVLNIARIAECGR